MVRLRLPAQSWWLVKRRRHRVEQAPLNPKATAGYGVQRAARCCGWRGAGRGGRKVAGLTRGTGGLPRRSFEVATMPAQVTGADFAAARRRASVKPSSSSAGAVWRRSRIDLLTYMSATRVPGPAADRRHQRATRSPAQDLGRLERTSADLQPRQDLRLTTFRPMFGEIGNPWSSAGRRC